jgi:CrcB protein
VKTVILNACYVGLGGALGTVSRYFVYLASRGLDARWNHPVSTLLVNILGSFLIGILAGLFAVRGPSSDILKHFLIIGFLGGFTTFSAFSHDVVHLAGQGLTGQAVLHAAGHLILCVMATLCGIFLIRYFVPG